MSLPFPAAIEKRIYAPQASNDSRFDTDEDGESMRTNTSNWTGKIPRTMESAFGSGVTDLHTEPRRGATRLVAVMVAACGMVAWLCWWAR